MKNGGAAQPGETETSPGHFVSGPGSLERRPQYWDNPPIELTAEQAEELIKALNLIVEEKRKNRIAIIFWHRNRSCHFNWQFTLYPK